MRKLRRLLLVAVVTLAVIGVGLYWISPVWLSISTARSAPPTARLVPSDLKDLFISPTPGTKLSYFGYNFEVPWSDVDEAQTKLYSNQVILTFRSGLRLMFGVAPAKLWIGGFASGLKTSPKAIESVFGRKATQSDYDFLKKLYGFTPDKLHCWAISPDIHYREVFLLSMKSAAVLPFAETGFFNIQNQEYRGFQQGNPQARSTVNVALFSDQGNIDFTMVQKDYQSLVAVSQGDLNRIIQSLHKSFVGLTNDSESTRR